jgi:hypothetical protein
MSQSDEPVAFESEAPPGQPSGAKWLAGVLVAVVVAAGTWFWLTSRGSGPAREVARQFIRDLSSGDVAAAHAKCTSDVDLSDLQRQAGYAKDWGPLRDVSMSGLAGTDPSGARTMRLQATVEFEKLTKHFSATTVEVDGQAKIKAFSFD